VFALSSIKFQFTCCGEASVLPDLHSNQCCRHFLAISATLYTRRYSNPINNPWGYLLLTKDYRISYQSRLFRSLDHVRLRNSESSCLRVSNCPNFPFLDLFWVYDYQVPKVTDIRDPGCLRENIHSRPSATARLCHTLSGINATLRYQRGLMRAFKRILLPQIQSSSWNRWIYDGISATDVDECLLCRRIGLGVPQAHVYLFERRYNISRAT
jgi:hypothetical protein